jgi:hypothetical protein
MRKDTELLKLIPIMESISWTGGDIVAANLHLILGIHDSLNSELITLSSDHQINLRNSAK